MRNNTLFTWGIVAVILIIGLLVYSDQIKLAIGNPPNATSTTATSTTVIKDLPPVVHTASAPTVITNSGSNPTDTTVIVSGYVTPNGTFTNYWYEYGTTQNLGYKTQNQSVGSGYVNTSAPGYITGLSKDTIYFFRLVAENQYGKIAGIVYSLQTTHGNPPPVGSAPTTRTIAASNISRTSVDFNGSVNPNRATTQYWFEYGTTASLGNTTPFTNVGENSSDLQIKYALGGLNPNTVYYFRLNAQNQFSTMNGNILTFRTAGPTNITIPVVSTRSATSINNNTATLRANINPNGADTTYWFEYSVDPLFSNTSLQNTNQQVLAGNKTTTGVSFDISGLQSKTNYYYRIVA